MVTVVVPVYNGMPRVLRTVEALKAQNTPRDLEIIVVDDGSTDGTPDELSRIRCVRTIRQPNLGPATARNRGANEAHGSIIVFVDADCVPDRNFIERLSQRFEQDDAVAAVRGSYLTTQQQIVARLTQLEFEERYDRLEQSIRIDFFDSYALAIRRKAFQESGGFDERYPNASAEDAELSFRFAEAGHKIAFVRDAWVEHVHPSSFFSYWRKKWKFARWRVLAVRHHPQRTMGDSNTPRAMLFQMLGVVLACVGGALWPITRTGPVLVGTGFVMTAMLSIGFVRRVWRDDRAIALFALPHVLCRASAQSVGVLCGIVDLVGLKLREVRLRDV